MVLFAMLFAMLWGCLQCVGAHAPGWVHAWSPRAVCLRAFCLRAVLQPRSSCWTATLYHCNNVENVDCTAKGTAKGTECSLDSLERR